MRWYSPADDKLSCLSLHAIIFDEIYPIFAASPRQNGLQFSSKDIAASLSVMGPIILVVQLLLYPYLNDHFSSLSLWRASAAAFAIVYPIFSLLPHISEVNHGTGRILQWAVLLIFLAIRFAANVVGYTSISVLVKLAPPSRCWAIER